MIFYYTPIIMTKILKKTENIKYGQGNDTTGTLKLYCLESKMVNHFGKQSDCFFKSYTFTYHMTQIFSS